MNWMELEAKMGGGIRTHTIAITQAILKLIAEIGEFKGAWMAIGRISSERLTALPRVATIESIGSSTRIEAFGPDGESLGVVFETATPFDTSRLMTELVEWTQANLERGELHKLIVITVFVVVFLAIHPFQDGNGRLSRGRTRLAAVVEFLAARAPAAKSAARGKNRARACDTW